MNIFQCHEEKKTSRRKICFIPIAECPRTGIRCNIRVRFLLIRASDDKHDLNNYNTRVYMYRGHGTIEFVNRDFFPPYTTPLELYMK